MMKKMMLWCVILTIDFSAALQVMRDWFDEFSDVQKNVLLREILVSALSCSRSDVSSTYFRISCLWTFYHLLLWFSVYLAVVVPEPFEVSLFGKVSKCTETAIISIFQTYSDFCNLGLLVNISRYFYQMHCIYLYTCMMQIYHVTHSCLTLSMLSLLSSKA